jgi:Ni/Co efflux regulator RcnB
MARARVLALALLAAMAVAAPGAQAEAGAAVERAGAGGPRRQLRIFRTKDEEAAHKQQREALVNVRPARSLMARARPPCACAPGLLFKPGRAHSGFRSLTRCHASADGVQAAGGG